MNVNLYAYIVYILYGAGRVWNKGRPKQCASEPEPGETFCSMHGTLVRRYGGWHLGRYDQPCPEEHLYDCTGHIQQGARIPWQPD